MNAVIELPSPARSRVDPRLIAALVTVYVIWGSTYLAMRIAVDALPPWGMAGTRFVVAGVVALAIARARGEAMPSARDWLLALPTGVFLFFFGNGFMVLAEQSLPSSVGAVAAATTPLFASAMNAARGERPSRAELAGMGLGMIGVVLLMGSTTVLSAGFRGLFLLGAPIGFALGSLLVRARGKAGSALAVAAPQMLSGGGAMLVMSVASGEHVPAVMPWSAVAAWAYLVVFGSLVGFTAYAWLLRNARPAVAMSYAYVNPIIAVVVGAVLAGEHLAWSTALAVAFIVSGVMVTISYRSRRPGPRS